MLSTVLESKQVEDFAILGTKMLWNLGERWRLQTVKVFEGHCQGRW